LVGEAHVHKGASSEHLRAYGQGRLNLGLPAVSLFFGEDAPTQAPHPWNGRHTVHMGASSEHPHAYGQGRLTRGLPTLVAE